MRNTRRVRAACASTWACARRLVAANAPHRRAVTLIELLIVLGLLVAIAAIALPTTLRTVARRQFESDVDSILGQLRLARNHARTMASAVEVVVSADGENGIRVVASVVDVRDLAHDALDVGDESARLGADAPPDGDTAASGGAIDASWADVRYELSLGDPQDETSSPTGDLPDDSAPSNTSDHRATAPVPGESHATSGPARRRVALFVADGGAPIAARLVIRDADGRSATIVVNPWTGIASMNDGSRGAATTIAATTDDETAPSSKAAPAAPDR